MKDIAWWVGAIWIGLIVTLGGYLGVTGVFFDAPGLIFHDGYGDIYILVILAIPGYLVWKWGGGWDKINLD